MQQRSPEWFAARAGKFSSSRFSDLMARTKTGVSKLHENLVVRVAIERRTGTHFDTYQNYAMARGTELEEEARQAYEEYIGAFTDEVGIVIHPTIPYVSVSPDSLCFEDGGAEFKCPFAEAKHFDALRRDGHVAEYWWQVQGMLWVTGRTWWDVCSYDPRFAEGDRLVVARVFRDEKSIADLEAMCLKSNDEVIAILAELDLIQERRRVRREENGQDRAQFGPSVQDQPREEGSAELALAEVPPSGEKGKGRRKGARVKHASPEADGEGQDRGA